MPLLRVRRVFLIRGLHPNDVDVLRFGSGGVVTVDWHKVYENARTVHSGADSLLVASTERTIGGKPGAGLEALAKRRWPEGEAMPEAAAKVFSADGTLMEGAPFPAYQLPSHVADELEKATGDIDEALSRVLRLLVWRSGAQNTAPWVLNRVPHEVSLDGHSWVPVLTRKVRLVVDGLSSAINVSGSLADFATTAFASGDSAPVAHELLEEARLQLGLVPRSALVMAVAAAEIGYKHAVADLTPDAKWLILEMPSPSLDRLLREHLPTLPARERFNGKVFCPDYIIKELRVAVTLRNSLVHKGIASLERPRLESIARAVEDLLLILDYFCGHTWAAALLSDATCTALEIPPGGRPTPAVAMYVRQGEAVAPRTFTLRHEVL